MAFEGFRSKSARLDDGRWTIGYGHTLTAREGVVITQPDAEALLLYDLIKASHAVNELVFAPLTQNQFDALTSFVFNIGVRAFRGSPTLRRLNEGRPLDAALAMELWRKADLEGERIVIDSLVRRRAAEKALFLKPMEGWIPAPTPILPPKLDYDAMALIPLTSPVAARAAMDGDRAFAERTPQPPAAPVVPTPAASEVAATAVIERLSAILAEPAAAPVVEPEAGVVAPSEPEAQLEPAPTPEPEPPPPEPIVEAPPAPPSPSIAETLAAASPKLTPPPSIPSITFMSARTRRRWLGGLGILALGVLGVGLLALAAIWGFQSESEQVLGVSPHTAGLTIGLIGIVCFGIAAYVMLDRLGTPRDRHFD